MPTTKPIDTIVTETMDDIKEKIKNVTSEEEANEVIKACLNTAFTQVDESDRQKLFKKLSLQLHSDKLHKHRELHEKLTTFGAVDAPQKLLNEYKQPGFFHAFAEAFTEATEDFNNVAADPVQGTKNFLYSLFDKLTKMLFEYKRYPAPINYLVNIVSWMINIALVVGVIAAAIVIGIASIANAIVDSIKNNLANLITNDQYTSEIETFKNSPVQFAKARKSYVNSVRLISKFLKPEDAAEIDAMSDDQIIDAIVQNEYITKLMTRQMLGIPTSEEDQAHLLLEAQENVNNKIKQKIQPHGWNKVVLMAKAFGHAIASPLSGGVFNKIALVLFVKPVQVLLIAPFIAATIAIELVRYVNTVLIITAITAAVLAKVISLALLNLPLYFVDAVRFIARNIRGCFKNAESAPTEENDNEATNTAEYSHRKMKAALSASAEKTTEAAPAEQGTYTKLHSEKPVASSNEPDFENPLTATPSITCP